MLRRILFTLFVIIAIAGGVVGYLYYQRLKVPTAAAISAVPQNASIIIQIRKSSRVWKNFKEKNSIWKNLISTPYFSNLNNNLGWLESIVNENSRLEDALDNSPLLISYHAVDSLRKGFLFSISVPADIEDRYLDELIKTEASPEIYFSQRVFGNTIVYEAKSRNKSEVFSYAIKKGVFIASFTPAVLELAINQLNESRTLNNNPLFDRVYKTLNTRSEISILVNHSAFFSSLTPLLNDTVKGLFNTLQQTAEWTALDFKYEDELITFSGLSSTSNDKHYISSFANQTPSRQTLTSILPINTSAFLSFNLSDFNGFYSKHQTFNELTEGAQNAYLKSLGNEFALVYTDDSDNQIYENAYLIGRPNGINTVRNSLLSLSEKAKNVIESEKIEEITEGDYSDKKRENENKTELEKSIKKDMNEIDENETSADSSKIDLQPKVYEIRKLKAGCNWGKLLGKTFGVITENYFAIVGDYIVYGNSCNSIERIIQNFHNKRTLNESEVFKSFSKNLNTNACLTIYNCPARDISFVSNAFNRETRELLSPYFEQYSQFEGAAIQLAFNKGLFYTQICLLHSPTSKVETSAFLATDNSNSSLQIELDAPAAIKPKIVINHVNQSKEIIVQDQLNNLYLISSKGEIIWKKRLEETILSEIKQVDRYKNNKLQYVFNTRNYIYMVDRNGNFCDGFPVKLKYPSTNQMSVFDYENNRDYRFVIACENNRVYNYDSKGENVNGWEFTLMKNNIIHQVQHFVINGKDYIIAIDRSGEIRLVDRKGKSLLSFNHKVPIAVNSDFFIEKGKELSSSYIIASDSLGRVLKFRFNDRLEILELKPASKNHYFEYKDVNGDGKRDFLVADGNELNVFNQDQTLQFSYKTKGAISNKPLFFLFPNGKIQIGLVSKNANSIYLINAEGKTSIGFPKPGATGFSIGKMGEDRKFKLVVGTNENKLFFHSLEN